MTKHPYHNMTYFSALLLHHPRGTATSKQALHVPGAGVPVTKFPQRLSWAQIRSKLCLKRRHPQNATQRDWCKEVHWFRSVSYRISLLHVDSIEWSHAISTEYSWCKLSRCVAPIKHFWKSQLIYDINCSAKSTHTDKTNRFEAVQY